MSWPAIFANAPLKILTKGAGTSGKWRMSLFLGGLKLFNKKESVEDDEGVKDDEALKDEDLINKNNISYFTVGHRCPAT